MAVQTPLLDSPNTEERAESGWVRLQIIAFFAVIGIAAGLIILDAKVAEIIGAKRMSGFRTILFLSVLLAGLGARALLAWRSATVDLQGRIFLVLVGLLLLTAAAVGISDCLQEIREHQSGKHALLLSPPQPKTLRL